MSDFAEITYNATQVVCENPRLIINPLLPELIAKHHLYYLRGRMYRDNRVHCHYFAFDYSKFSVKKNGITKVDIPTSFVVDETTGETYPIYIEVPCNHCDVCKERKISSFVQRCKLETQCYDCKPWFVTLTYDNQHVPSHGVCIDEVQRFLKRLRINLVRAGFNKRIRYVLVGEYGKNTHRPHYHAIFWNIGAKTHQEYLTLVDILDKSWNCGFIQHRIINPENDKAFYYTAKYLKKDCFVPNGCNPTFILSSRGHGGIGSKFLDSIAPELRRTLNVSFKFLNKWSHKVEDLVFSQYVLNRIFPSWSKAVPSVLRRSLADFALCYSSMAHYNSNSLFYNQIEKLHERYLKYFAPWVYYCTIPMCDVPKKACLGSNGLEELCFSYSRTIEKYYDRIDFQEAKKVHEKRGLFVSKLFMHQQPVDIGARAYKARRNFGLSVARELL